MYSHAALTLSVRREADAAVVVLGGELNQENSPMLDQELEDLLLRPSAS